MISLIIILLFATVFQNVGCGWFLSKNIVTKFEYVNQQYTGDAWTGRFAGAKFDGFNIEAAISF